MSSLHRFSEMHSAQSQKFFALSLVVPTKAAFASDVQARFAAFFWAALETCCRAAADSFFAADVAEVAEVPLVSVEVSEEACALAANLS